MGFVVFRSGEIRLVGCDQRKTLGIGEIDQRAFDAPFLVKAVALQLDIEPVAENPGKVIATRSRKGGMIGIERQSHRPIGAAGQGYQPFAFVPKPLHPDVGDLMLRGFEERPGIQPHQVPITSLARCQQHNPGKGERVARRKVLIAELDREFTPDDRLDPVTRNLIGKFQRTEHIVGVGERQRRLMVGLGQFGQLLDLDRALQQRIGRMDVQVDETGVGGSGLLDHGRSSGAGDMLTA